MFCGYFNLDGNVLLICLLLVISKQSEQSVKVSLLKASNILVVIKIGGIWYFFSPVSVVFNDEQ